MTSPALRCAQLGFRYPDGNEALHDLGFSLAKGERLAVVGPNGAGKTTLFHLICGLLAPSMGEVEALGRPVEPGRFNPGIALVFQDADDQLFCPTVREDVGFGPSNMDLPAAEVQLRVAQALDAVGAMALAERPVHHLSGGEKRMVCLAGALAMQPAMILFDEPSAGLDLRNRRRLIERLQGLRETLVLASHDLELLLEVCDRVLLLDEGRLVADGPIREVFGNEALMRAHGQEKPHSLLPHGAANHHLAPPPRRATP
jgi:cobalt/nickel transport system ATP-binding protein